jgi:hypothetical protein
MAEKSKPKIIMPTWTDVLVYAGALANTALWIRAGEMVENGNFWARVSSVALGVVMSFGPVQIIQKWATLAPTLERKKRGQAEIESRANPRYWLAVGAFALILASEALLLAPVVVAMMTAQSLPSVLGWLVGAWAAGRVLISAIALAGLSAVLGTHSQAQRPVSAPSDQLSETSDEKPAQSKKKLAEQEITCAHEGAGCDRVFSVSKYGSLKSAQNAANAHSKKCAYKPTVVDVSQDFRK